MRVTAQTKAATEERILRAARRLFTDNGYDATTTRDIAKAAEIASGTLFNYFSTKEAIISRLAADAVGDSLADSDPTVHGADSLDEALFAMIASGLRSLRPFRKHLPALFETSLSPLAMTPPDESRSLRVGHLEAVAALAARHGYRELSPTALQLYWTLYTGVLVFWANDESPKQEETLALIDDSLNMFVGWLRADVQTDPSSKR
jgi:AcrR family transcriptional regulator